MADLNVQKKSDAPGDDYTMLEVVFWIVGILMIPGVPILMVYFLTPFSGM
ncbi:MAG: hypothetical protein M3409_02240 [Gemmatimonadota bacterium]|nr:hypothetical protein [Gemmatimonadota bacterium]